MNNVQRLCKACSSVIPDFIRVGKKLKSLRSRVYCCQCSPYKEGGRKRLEKFKIINQRQHKFCDGCELWIDLDNFHLSKSSANNKYYPASRCKVCARTRSTKRGRSMKKRAVAYKGGQCSDCKVVADPCIYDFHHVDPSEKDFIIARKFADWNVVMRELDKCILLCSNCHRLRHYKSD